MNFITKNLVFIMIFCTCATITSMGNHPSLSDKDIAEGQKKYAEKLKISKEIEEKHTALARATRNHFETLPFNKKILAPKDLPTQITIYCAGQYQNFITALSDHKKDTPCTLTTNAADLPLCAAYSQSLKEKVHSAVSQQTDAATAQSLREAFGFEPEKTNDLTTTFSTASVTSGFIIEKRIYSLSELAELSKDLKLNFAELAIIQYAKTHSDEDLNEQERTTQLATCHQVLEILLTKSSSAIQFIDDNTNILVGNSLILSIEEATKIPTLREFIDKNKQKES